MKKVIWTGTDTLEYSENAENPDDPGEKDVLVHITAVGLCSTDVHIIQGKVRFKEPPHVLGHEIAGKVEKVGAGVTGVKPGDRVTIDSVVGCGTCRFCKRGSAQLCPNGYEFGQTVNGGMQEFLCVPEINVFQVPGTVSDEESAILDTEILGTLRKPGITRDSSLVVIGPGPAGLIAIQVGKILGAGKVILIGTRSERLELGKRLGADYVIKNTDENLESSISEFTDGNAPDLVLDTAGTSSSLAMAIKLVAPQGKVILYGLHGSPVPSVDIDQIILKDIVVYGALPDRHGWEEMIGWIADGTLNLKDIITHRFHFKDAQKAYECIRDRSEGAVKAVLIP